MPMLWFMWFWWPLIAVRVDYKRLEARRVMHIVKPEGPS